MKDIDGIDHALEVLKHQWTEIEADFARHNERFLALASADHDAIGRVLRAHLVVENFLDTYLAETLGVEDISGIKLTFAQKAKLLPFKSSSAAFVRPGVIQLNSVRNKFGHRISHQIEEKEVSAILEVLRVARPSYSFSNFVEAIEAFAPVACAFLSVPPRHLQELFAEAFSYIRPTTPENCG